MNQIIDIPRSVIPACDVDWGTYTDIVTAAAQVEKVQVVKIGIALALEYHGLAHAVKVAHDRGLKVIYDHQKAGTDIHESTPQIFMDRMVEGKVDAVILFPLSGPVVQYEWTINAQLRGLEVIIGGEMTHPRFLETNMDNGKKAGQNYTKIFDEYGLPDLNGYIRGDAPEDIYSLAAAMGVRDFVVPGNKPDRITFYRKVLSVHGVEDAAFYSPGLVAQGGSLSEGTLAAGERFHGIVGRGITQAEDKRAAMEELTAKI